MKKIFLVLALAALAVPVLQAQVRITEFAYNGSEFIEFTNLGSSTVDFAGWSFSDSARTPGSVSLSAFGLVGAGESVIVAEVTEAAFRSLWNLSASVKVIGGNTQNLGRGDEINLYNTSGVQVDRLTYDDRTIGGVRTEFVSAWAPASALGQNTAATWIGSTVGDAQGSFASVGGAYVANPGINAVPEPTTVALIAIGLGLVLLRMRRTATKL